MWTETREKCSNEGCDERRRKNKLFCDHHYIQDLEGHLDYARDKAYDYEKQIIPEMDEKLKICIKALDSICDRYFDMPPELRMHKGLRESRDSLTAKAALKLIGAR